MTRCRPIPPGALGLRGGAGFAGGESGSGGSVGAGGSGGAKSELCEDLESSAEVAIREEVAERLACSSDEDCVQTKLVAGCSRPCGLIVNAAGADEMPAIVQDACAEYRESECPNEVYPCLVSLLTTPVCTDGVCSAQN